MTETTSRYDSPESEGEEAGFDLRLARGYASFAWRAIKKNRPVVLLCVLLALGAAAGLLAVLPRTYVVDTSILAQRNQVIATLGNPSRQGFGDVDVPTRAAADAIMRRDNLISLIKQTGLDKSWYATRSPAGRVMDVLRRLVRGSLSDDQLVDALANLLERRLYVVTTDNKIIIGIRWWDAPMAYRLVAAAEQNFIESRHVTEISLIAESISILESHAATAREEVERALQEVRSRPQARTVLAAPAAAAKPVDDEVARLGVLLIAKRRAVRDLEDFRRRRLNELQAQLAEQKAIYAESHPNVIAIEESIKGLLQDSPQLVSLEREAQEIESEYRRRGGQPLPEADQGGAASTARLTPVPSLVLERASRSDASDDFARQRLSAATARYDVLLDRISSARVELDAARAAFKYRYIVVRPPKHPERADRPRVPYFVTVGAFLGLLLGLGLAVALEARRGLIVQAWQVESLLELPILGELRR